MPKHVQEWSWEEAFSKFGFEDGDGWNGTSLVSDFIESLGYSTECENWGMHNYLIVKLFMPDSTEVLCPLDEMGKGWGYREPRGYLPQTLVRALDEEFNESYQEE